MFENNRFNINIIAKQCERPTENYAWEKRFYDKFQPQNFSQISLLDVIRRINQLTYSFCFLCVTMTAATSNSIQL